MKNKLILAAAACALVVPAIAVAKRGFPMEPPATRIAAMETAEARFAQADSDGDGRVTAEEMVERAQARAARHAEFHFERQDLNADGFITKDEIKETAALRFDRVDADGDGIITEEEAEKARPHGHRGRGRR